MNTVNTSVNCITACLYWIMFK